MNGLFSQNGKTNYRLLYFQTINLTFLLSSILNLSYLELTLTLPFLFSRIFENSFKKNLKIFKQIWFGGGWSIVITDLGLAKDILTKTG